MPDPDPKKVSAAIAQIQDLSPEAAKTLRALASTQSGDLSGAKATLDSEPAPHGLDSQVNQWMTIKENTSKAALAAGDKVGAITDEREVFGAQLGSDAGTKLFMATYVNPNQQQADAVRSTIQKFAGAEAVKELDQLNLATAEVIKDQQSGKNSTYDAQEQWKHAIALHNILKKTADSIVGGETPSGNPKAQVTPVVPGAASAGRSPNQ